MLAILPALWETFRKIDLKPLGNQINKMDNRSRSVPLTDKGTNFEL